MTSQVYSPTQVELSENNININYENDEQLPQQELSYDYIPQPMQYSIDNFVPSTEVVPTISTLSQSFSKEHTIIVSSPQQINSQQGVFMPNSSQSVTTSSAQQQPTLPNNNTILDPIFVVLLDLLFPGLGHVCANLPNPPLKEYFPLCKKYPRGWVYLVCSFVFLILNALPLMTAWIPYVNIIGMLISFIIFIPNIIIQIALRIVAVFRSYAMQQKMIELYSKPVSNVPGEQRISGSSAIQTV